MYTVETALEIGLRLKLTLGIKSCLVCGLQIIVGSKGKVNFFFFSFLLKTYFETSGYNIIQVNSMMKVRCIKHLDVLTVGSDSIFITVKIFLRSND